MLDELAGVTEPEPEVEDERPEVGNINREESLVSNKVTPSQGLQDPDQCPQLRLH